MSLGEISFVIRGVNEASPVCEAVELSLTSVARGISSLGMMGTRLISLAADFGVVDKETAKWMRTITLAISLAASIGRVINFISQCTTGEAASLSILTGAHTISIAATISHTAATVAHGVAQAATALATWFMNTALMVQVGLFTLGIGIIIAMTAVMWGLAEANRAAAASAAQFKESMSGMESSYGRNLRRGGEEAMYRKGVE